MLSTAKWITVTNKKIDGVSHFLFRKTFDTVKTDGVKVTVAAKDFFLLYINGFFIAKGTAAKSKDVNCYTFNIEDYLFEGENTIAIHTVSRDGKNGVIARIYEGNNNICVTDEDWRCLKHDGYSFDKTADTPLFFEVYDARSECVEFELNFYDDNSWYEALLLENPPKFMLSVAPAFKSPIKPIATKSDKNNITFDFGRICNGRLFFCANGQKGGVAVINYFNDINDKHCSFPDALIFSGSDEDMLQLTFERDFRFVEIVLPPKSTVVPDSICIL